MLRWLNIDNQRIVPIVNNETKINIQDLDAFRKFPDMFFNDIFHTADGRYNSLLAEILDRMDLNTKTRFDEMLDVLV